MIDNLNVYLAYDIMDNPNDYDLAIALLDKAIEEKSLAAYFYRGYIEYQKNNYQEAYYYFRTYYKNGGNGAFFYLSQLAKLSDVKKEYPSETEIFYLLKGDEAGDVSCIRKLAMKHHYYGGSKEENKLFLEYIRKLIDKGPSNNRGFSEDCIVLADYYNQKFHKEEDPDYSYTIDLLKRASNQGNSEAKTRLGLMYLNGKGVNQNPEKAIKYLHDAAINGEKYAIETLAKLFMRGSKYYKKKNIDLTRYYANIGIKHKDAQCVFYLAESYLFQECGSEELKIVKELMEQTLPKVAMKKDKYKTQKMLDELKELYPNDLYWKYIEDFLKEKHLIRYW